MLNVTLYVVQNGVVWLYCNCRLEVGGQLEEPGKLFMGDASKGGSHHSSPSLDFKNGTTLTDIPIVS